MANHSTGYVGYFNKDLEELVSAYSLSTGRQPLFLENDFQQPVDPRLEVLVSFASEISIHLLDRMYNDCTPQAPGLIIGNSLSEIAGMLSRKPAQWAPLNGNQYTRLDFLANFQTGEIRLSEEQVILGHQSSGESIRHHFAKGYDIVHIMTHADGLDGFLGPQTILCPIDHDELLSEKNRPSCIIHGHCYRLNKSLEAARKSGGLVFPDAIGARVLLLNVCWGVLSREAVVDPAWGFASRLLRNPSIGCIITTWKSIHAAAETVEPVIGQLLKGETAGKAVGAFNHSPLAAATDTQFCILGDPSAVLFPSGPVETAVEARSFIKRPPVTNAGLLQSLNFLKLLFAGQLAMRPNLVLQRKAILLLEQIGYSFLSGGMIDEAMRAELDAITLEIFSTSVLRPFDTWMNFMPNMQVAADTITCNYCSSGSSVLEYAPDHAGTVPSRILVNCPVCGIIKDGPSAVRTVDFEVLGNRKVRITGLGGNESRISGGFIFYYKKKMKAWNVLLIETATDPGEDVVVDIPVKFIRKGVLELSLFLLIDFQMMIINKKTRGELL